ncbi:hypothetical protein L195_g041480, partial [Trifolium pratense]
HTKYELVEDEDMHSQPILVMEPGSIATFI